MAEAGNAAELRERLRAAAPAVSVGILAGDRLRLGEELAWIEQAGAGAAVHVDVGDGRFSPLLDGGPALVRALSTGTRLPLDVHLMVCEPERWVAEFAPHAGIVTFNLEGARDPYAALQRLKAARGPDGLPLCGVALTPGIPVAAAAPLVAELDLLLVLGVSPGVGGGMAPATPARVAEAVALRAATGGSFLVGADGGVTPATAPALVRAGAELLVSGSALLAQPDRDAALRNLRAALAAGRA